MASSRTTFWVLVVGSQVCGLLAYFLLQSWLLVYNGGFDWNSDTSHLIQNYHALFMTLGFLLLFGEATLAYRLLARTGASYLLQKSVHATILIAATVIWAVGLGAAFRARNMDQTHGKDVEHLYSFHSWIGVILLVVFGCQFLWYSTARISTLRPSQLCFAVVWYAHARLISPAAQAAYQSIHVFNGLFLFTLATATCFTGLNELAIYKAENYSLMSRSGVHLNLVGLAMLGFGTMIGYLLWKPDFKLTPPVGEPTGASDHVENNLHPMMAPP